jgi:tartrate/fumarate subfamily iron-sulfur-dependent hydro-lyase beta chain
MKINNNFNPRELNLGDAVEINGTIFAARDKAHDYLLKNKDIDIKNAIIYHCGPVIQGSNVIAAGPTTSTRMNIFTPELIKKYSIKAIIGKGGMDQNSVDAMKRYGCVYLNVVGGAAVILANSVKRIKNVYKKEFGMAEAIYEFEVEDFPAIVTIDTQGNSIHENIRKESRKKLELILNGSR